MSVTGGNGIQLTGAISITGNVNMTASKLNVAGSITATAFNATSNSIVSGNGTMSTTALSSSTLRVGNDPGAGCCADPHTIGILTSGNYSATGGTMAFDLTNSTPGTGHDQLAVNGTVTLSNPTLAITFPALIPANGTSFTIINNDGADAVSGTFAGLPQGSELAVGPTRLRITYVGGTGNDVVLTVLHTTSTVLTSSQNPTVSGESFTLTATVTSSGGTPTGTVSFEEGVTVLGTSTLNGAGQATLTLALPAGAHSIVARYLGAGSFAASTSAPLVQNVNPGSTTTTLTTSPNPSSGGIGIVAQVQVNPVAPASGIPTGTVTIRVDGNVVATAPLDASGHASITLPPLGSAGGTHTIRADYSGDANFGPSFAVTQQQIIGDAPTLSTAMLLLLISALAILGARVVMR